MSNIYYNLESLLLIYMVFINLINLMLFALDKKRARSKSWRIPENTLFFLSLLGGSLGGLIAMNIFRHKTQKFKFRFGLPILLIINLISLIYLMAFIEKVGMINSPQLHLF